MAKSRVDGELFVIHTVQWAVATREHRTTMAFISGFGRFLRIVVETILRYCMSVRGKETGCTGKDIRVTRAINCGGAVVVTGSKQFYEGESTVWYWARPISVVRIQYMG